MQASLQPDEVPAMAAASATSSINDARATPATSNILHDFAALPALPKHIIIYAVLLQCNGILQQMQASVQQDEVPAIATATNYQTNK